MFLFFIPYKTHLMFFFFFFFLIKELRYYAYFTGNIRPPTSVLMDPFVQLAKDTQVAATTPIEDQYQSISAQPQYDKHSHEVRFSLIFSI